ncbi:unnamed protein product [Calypogeia fissa]
MDLLSQLSFVETLCCASSLAVALVVLMRILFRGSGSQLGIVDTTDGANAITVPKGSLGLPFLGEIVQFALSDPVTFSKPRVEKYGKVFKTSLMGTPTVMVTCPEFAKYVLTDRQQEFQFTFPLYVEKLLGDGGLGFPPETGPAVHRVAQIFLTPELLRHQVAAVEAMALETLNSWAAGETVECVANKSIKFSMNVGVRFILGLEPEHPLSLKLQGLFETYTGGLRCLPIRLPGTDFSKALKAKKLIQEELQIFIKQGAESRKGCQQMDPVRTNFLDLLLDDENIRGGDSELPLHFLSTLFLHFLFAAREPVGYTITWAMKLLWESPESLEALTKENDEIRSKKGQGESLTWTDYKEMKYTFRVIQEMLRISSVANGPTRRALQDVRFGKHLIPKDWNVMVLFPAIHKNSEYFPNPLRFDPSRFEKAPKPNTFLPFGSGRHACVGVELAKLEIFVFLHLLTTQFSWEVIGADAGIVSYPWPIPRGGLRIKIRPRVPWDRECQTQRELSRRS